MSKLQKAAPAQPAFQVVSSDADRSEGRRRRTRHALLLGSFVIAVLVPTALAAAYLWVRAEDQYHSRAAFSVRSEDYANPLEALGAFTQVGASSASDSQILYDFIRSQPLVTTLAEAMPLRDAFTRPDDPVFSLPPSATTEELIDHWERMVNVSVDSSSGVVAMQVRAFSPDEAQEIAQAAIDESARLVNDLSRIAREDAMRFAEEDVRAAEDRLRGISRRVQEFRIENEIIDPTAIAETQMGVISELQSRLADVLVERETLLGFADPEDQRVKELDRQIEAIRGQIKGERRRMGGAAAGPGSLAQSIGDYEELLVEKEFAQNAYQSALAAQEQARAEAQRITRYLAVHIPPTRAEESRYPQRPLLTLLVMVCSFAAWATAVLIYYNVRDRS